MGIPNSSLRDLLFREEVWHGLLFDTAVLFGHLLIARTLPTMGEPVSTRAVGMLLTLAVVAQMAGAVLKKEPLRSRLRQSHTARQSRFVSCFLALLLLLHFILFSTIVLLALLALGVCKVETDGAMRNEYWVLVAIVVAGLTTWMVHSAGQAKGPPAGPQPDGKSGWEYVADGLLWVSVLIVTRFFWDGLVDGLRPAGGIGLNGRGLMLLGAMTLLFMFFYLPTRYLFIVEDYRSPFMWARVCLAMAPVVVLVVEG